MRGYFEIPEEGRFLIGTYALRKLTKNYNCSPSELFNLASDGIESLSFTVLLLKYSRENARLQANGQENFKEVTETEIEFILDKIGVDEAINRTIIDALCQSISGKSLAELEEEGRKKMQEEQQEIEEEEKKIGSITGAPSKKSDGAKESDLSN